MAAIDHKKLNKALVWVEAHKNDGFSVAETCYRASWRFHVEYIDILYAYRKLKSENNESS